MRTTCITKICAIAIAALSLLLPSCHEAPDYKDTGLGNFDALWEIVDQHYCFFENKHIDWDSVYTAYRKKLQGEMTILEYYNICADMLMELRDGHVNLVAPFNTSYYRKWWSDYPQDFNLRTLQEYYLKFDYMSTSGISYKMMQDSIGYMYYPSFSYPIGELNLDYILAYLYKCKGLIIDIRDNGGGALTNIKTIVSRLIDKKTLGGYIQHKTGPGHNDFSEPYAVEYESAPDYRVHYFGPVIVLTNRSCFSAANDFTAVMKSLPNVAVIGARTGGGGGLPFSSELPNGWAVRFSACPLLDPEGKVTEEGIDPTPGGEVHASDEQLARGEDRILDFALLVLKRLQEEGNEPKEIRKTMRAINPD